MKKRSLLIKVSIARIEKLLMARIENTFIITWTPFSNRNICPNNQSSDEKLLVLLDDFITTRKKQREQRL